LRLQGRFRIARPRGASPTRRPHPLPIAEGWKPFSPTFLIGRGALTALTIVLDYATPLAGARRFGASKRGFWGAFKGSFPARLDIDPLAVGGAGPAGLDGLGRRLPSDRDLGPARGRADGPGPAIDHILVGPSIDVLRWGVLPGSWEGRFVSDHNPVLAEMRPARCWAARTA